MRNAGRLYSEDGGHFAKMLNSTVADYQFCLAGGSFRFDNLKEAILSENIQKIILDVTNSDNSETSIAINFSAIK